jgi:two-component system sensor histidine kinase KdpD
MNEDEMRPDPEEILHDVTKTNRQQGGTLKIFFGYAAGVGKTYAMLQAAHEEQNQGIDVVVGYVEPHVRPETSALLKGLESIPVHRFSHAGLVLEEPDIKAILARRPAIVLIDELAHTNAEGSWNTKRYQDVQELLTAGIDVYTTVNVQHLEGLNDRVGAITGIAVQERIPDHIFDDADQVEFVDIEPSELIERLQEGKIYRGPQAARALNNFFNTKNLTALREIALRRCADRANLVVERMRHLQGGGSYAAEHVLACLSPSPTNARILRTAARMARAFDAQFTALLVEPDGLELQDEDTQRLKENMDLAERLGATVETIPGDDIAHQICEYARVAGVSKLVLGRSTTQRRPFGRKTLTDRIAAMAPDFDIFIIPDEPTPQAPQRRQARSERPSGANIAKSLLMLSAVTAVGYVLESVGLSVTTIAILYVSGAVVVAMLVAERTSCLIYSLLSVLLFNYFFTEPRYTLVAWDPQYPATFAVMFLTSALISSLMRRLSYQSRANAESAYRMQVLLECDQLLQKATSSQQIIDVMVERLMRLLHRDIVYYPAQAGHLGAARGYSAGGSSVDERCINDNERAVAIWAFRNNKHAGATTKTLSRAACLYLSIRSNSTVYGVVGIVMGASAMDSNERNISLSILGETALALERHLALTKREEAEVIAKNERLRANLLRSVSHDLRTPLAAITGNSSLLMRDDVSIDQDVRHKLASSIYDDSLWLGDVIENILSLTRLDEANVELQLEPELVEEAVDEAMRHVSRDMSKHHVEIERPAEPVMAKMDVRLIVQVVINLVNNAIQHTPEGSHIRICTRQAQGKAIIDVADNGPGISDTDKLHIFERFFTAKDGVADHRRGTGLGLALCKSIMDAHGGDVQVFDNHPKGTLFRVTLPLVEEDNS